MVYYRPPSASIELLDYFNNFLQKADDEDKDIIITGDFNRISSFRIQRAH